jgi:hypothetical protein
LLDVGRRSGQAHGLQRQPKIIRYALYPGGAVQELAEHEELDSSWPGIRRQSYQVLSIKLYSMPR